MLMLLMAQTTEGTGKEDREALDRLLIEIAAGSREALAELYHRTRTAVYGITLSYVKNAHDAQDLTQDAFVRIWEKAPQYRPQGSPMAWILAVARNLALMALRQRERQRRSGTPFRPRVRPSPRRSGSCSRRPWRRWRSRSGGSWCSTPSLG